MLNKQVLEKDEVKSLHQSKFDDVFVAGNQKALKVERDISRGVEVAS